MTIASLDNYIAAQKELVTFFKTASVTAVGELSFSGAVESSNSQSASGEGYNRAASLPDSPLSRQINPSEDGRLSVFYGDDRLIIASEVARLSTAERCVRSMDIQKDERSLAA